MTTEPRMSVGGFINLPYPTLIVLGKIFPYENVID